jgi:uncharacterized protein YecE (DUF72 family)
VTANILVGTASWTDPSLIACGRFYPAHCRTAEQRLRFYAQQFPMVEVDSSYYALPLPQTAQLWVERTPADFVFNIKAYRLFTGHPALSTTLPRDLQRALGEVGRHVDYEQLPREIRAELWRRFREALAPLQAAGKLGAVHFQFAPWLLRNRASIAHVEHCVEQMQGHLLAAEFRHETWFFGAHLESTLAWERELALVHTVVDSPQGFVNCVPCVWDVSNPELAIVRLHGRNKETWNKKGLAASSARFDYRYSADELAAMVPEIAHLAAQARRVHVIFNTNNEDQGQANARLLRQVLQVNAR